MSIELELPFAVDDADDLEALLSEIDRAVHREGKLQFDANISSSSQRSRASLMRSAARRGGCGL